MKLLRCPLNGERPISEFVYGGPVRPMPDPASATDAQWAAHVFDRRSVPRMAREWWYHAASGTWFIAERDVVTDTVRATWLPADAPPPDEPSAGSGGSAERGA